MTPHLTIFGLLAMLNAGWVGPAGSTEPQQAAPRRACAPGAACCSGAFTSPPCRVGCPGPPPPAIKRVAPDLAAVSTPYPTGVLIVEIGLDEQARLVSSRVLRGLRSDFDEAVQAALCRWRWKPYLLNGRPTGVVFTLAVCWPGLECRPQPGRVSSPP